MIPITDFQQRALSGPVMKEQEFDMMFGRKVRQVVSRYDIKYEPERIIADDGRADAVFEGGVDLLAEVGLYHRDTQRVIQLSKEEVQQIAKEAWAGPRKERFGKGKDVVTIKYRTAEDPSPPVVWFGLAGRTSSEDLYIPYIQSFAQEEWAQGINAEGLISAGGLENKVGAPTEVAVALAEIKYKQEVARRVDKPGMFMGWSSAMSPGAVMALCFPGLQERHNAMIPIGLVPELKLDWDRLVLAQCAEVRGMVPFTSVVEIMGALCRGPEDAAVAQVANLLGQLGYGHGTIATTCAMSVDGFRDRGAMWAYSAAARASERNIGIPIGGGSQSAAGAGTEMALYEKAAQTLNFVASGTAWIWGMGCRRGKGENTTAGLEGRVVAETALAVAGMARDKVSELLKRVLALYEDQLGSEPEGKTFPELYDVKTVQPTAEYLAVYHRAKEQLARIGVPYR